MRAKSVFLLMLALGCGLVASIGITQVVASRNSQSSANLENMATILVAIEDVERGQIVTAESVKLEEWPKDRLPAEALDTIEAVEGRRTKIKIVKGSPLLDSFLRSEGASQSVAADHIPPGFRVVGVRVDNVSGGNMIRPTDRVDVLVHLTKNSSRDIADTTTQTILQDVMVFAVNDLYDLENTEASSRIVAQTISLLVPLEQAEKVILADQLGEIRLVMRSPNDPKKVLTKGVRVSDLFGDSDKSDRDAENIITGPQPSDFLALLNNGNNPPTQPVTPRASEGWTMRTIVGGKVDEVVLRLDNPPPSRTPAGPSIDNASADVSDTSDQSGFSLWKVISSTVRKAQPTPNVPQPREVVPQPLEMPPTPSPGAVEKLLEGTPGEPTPEKPAAGPMVEKLIK